MTAAGELVLSATVAYAQADPNPADNTLTLKANTPLLTPPPLTPPPTPAQTAPKLSHRRPALAQPLRASHTTTTATLDTTVSVDKPATITLTVLNPRTGKHLTLLLGSKLADTTLKQQATTTKTRLLTPRTFRIKALLRPLQLNRGLPYQLQLTATGTTGKTSQLKIRFLG